MYLPVILTLALAPFASITNALPTGQVTPTPATLTASTIPTAATVLPTPTCTAKVFDIPWILSDISVYQPDKSSSAHGTISFAFSDPNYRLKLSTTCFGNVTRAGQCEAENGGYVQCADERVAFKLEGMDLVMVERGYVDKCLGSPPYNTGIAFGQNNTEMTALHSHGYGTLYTQAEMLVAITTMA